MNENFDFLNRPLDEVQNSEIANQSIEGQKPPDKNQEKFDKILKDMKIGMQELEQLQKKRIAIKEGRVKTNNPDRKLALNAFKQLAVIKLMNNQTSSSLDVVKAIKDAKLDYNKRYGCDKPFDGDTNYLIAKGYTEASETNTNIIPFKKDKFSSKELTLSREKIAPRLNILNKISQNIIELESLKQAEGPEFKRSISFGERVYIPYSLPKNQEELNTLISSLNANPTSPSDGLIIITKPGEQTFSFWENEVKFPNGDSLKLIDETVIAEEDTDKERIVERNLVYTDKEGKTKEYILIHYQNWPDKEEPNQKLFTKLQENTRLLAGRGASVGICCETGKGPSASLIASIELSDVAHKELTKFDNPDEIDLPVAQTVLEMRMQVPGMFEKPEDLAAVYGNLKFQREQLSVQLPKKAANSPRKEVQFKDTVNVREYDANSLNNDFNQEVSKNLKD